MVKRLTKFAQVAGISLALALTFSCSGSDDGDEGGTGGSACPSGSTSLDGVWEFEGGKITISGSTGVVSALPPNHNNEWKVGDQVYRELTSTGNLTWSGQENVITEWWNVQLTMSADGQTLTAIDQDDTITYTRKCNNQSSGGGSSSPSGGGSLTGTSGTITDSRDSKPYKWVKIGEQYWLAENLNYAADGKCYDNDPANCTEYGRLYDWETANTACPSGWRLPSKDDWDVLITAVGGYETAGKYLKSKSGWNGEDKFGFSALPGGFDQSVFDGIGIAVRWWSSSELEGFSDYYHFLQITNYDDVSLDMGGLPSISIVLLSVRCIKKN